MKELFLVIPNLFVILITVIGLLIGSFLNVVIYRLPIMLQRSWRRECLDYLQMPIELESEVFNLSLPSSRCPHCLNPIKAYQNIPVISYVFLKGQCAHCKHVISFRYPAIELLTGVASAIVAWHFGYTVQAGFALILTWVLIALSFIDIDQQLLPDNITLPVLWLGLFLSVFGVYTDTQASILGAIAGYMVLWCVYQAFKLVTGKEGMGYGDFKLLALLGAWLGWQMLPLIILLSSVVGVVIGVGMIVLVKHDHRVPIPFGPYLATAGWIALLWGNQINQVYLTSVGL